MSLMSDLAEEAGGLEPEAVEPNEHYAFFKDEEMKLFKTIKEAASSCDVSVGIRRFLENVIEHCSDASVDLYVERMAGRGLYKFLGEGI